MAIEISSAGAAVKWSVEATAGTRPTTGYKVLRGVTAIGADNDAPNMLQTTKLSEMVRHTAIPGLRGGADAQPITVNDYADFRTDWESLMADYETAKAAGKALWIEYAYQPGSGLDSYFYPAIPVDLGYGGAEVDSVMTNTAYLVITGSPVFATASA